MHIMALLVGIVVTVLAASLIADRLRVSAPLVLLLLGVIGSFVPWIHEPSLPPELVLVGILPPLLYAAARSTSLLDFRANLPAISLLSVGLVLFTTVGVGLVVWSLLPVPLAAALAMGAVVGPPDAVAATAVARRIGLPRRVVTVLEGESLVNDATALVALRSAVAAMAGGVTALSVGADFVWAVVGGVGVGAATAVLAKAVLRPLDDAVLGTAVTMLVPFVAFAPAERLHASGVLAVVVAGLVLGHSAPIVQSAGARVMADTNWRLITFLLENAVFLLVGLQTRAILSAAASDGLGWGRTLALAAAVLAAVVGLRVVWVLGTRVLVRVRGGQPSSGREALVIAWAGMRGVVTLAAALSLPPATPYRSTLVLVALAVTGGTLLLQGLTLPLLAGALGVRGPDPREDALQEAVLTQRAAAAGTRAARNAARAVDDEGEGRALAMLEGMSERRVNMAWERLGRPAADLETPSDIVRRLRSAAIRAERDEVLTVRSEGHVEHEVVQRVLRQLDLEELGLAYSRERVTTLRAFEPSIPDGPCDHLAGAPTLVVPRGCRGGELLHCPGCRAEGTRPVHLRLCLACGEVGCCDSSAGQHARRHFAQTGHPVIRSVEPGESWRWCYVDEVLGAGA